MVDTTQKEGIDGVVPIHSTHPIIITNGEGYNG